MRIAARFVAFVVIAAVVSPSAARAQEARRRWEMQRQIRLDKFDQILPLVMRAHGVDMWIVAMKENHYDPLWEDMGRGYVSGMGYYVFTDRGGDRIERAALGPSGYMIEQSGAYDIFAAASTLPAFVKERNPRRIGVNMSEEIGPADGLSPHHVSAPGEDARRAVRRRGSSVPSGWSASSVPGVSRPRSSRSARPPASRFS